MQPADRHGGGIPQRNVQVARPKPGPRAAGERCVVPSLARPRSRRGPVELPVGMAESVVERRPHDADGEPRSCSSSLAAVRSVAPDAFRATRCCGTRCSTSSPAALARHLDGCSARRHARAVGSGRSTWDGADDPCAPAGDPEIRRDFDQTPCGRASTEHRGLILQDYGYLQVDAGRRHAPAASRSYGSTVRRPVEGGRCSAGGGLHRAATAAAPRPSTMHAASRHRQLERRRPGAAG
jgi:hypothetical protein